MNFVLYCYLTRLNPYFKNMKTFIGKWIVPLVLFVVNNKAVSLFGYCKNGGCSIDMPKVNRVGILVIKPFLPKF